MNSYDIDIESRQARGHEADDRGLAGASTYAAAEVFKAVAHPVRATILELLSQGELSIPRSASVPASNPRTCPGTWPSCARSN